MALTQEQKEQIEEMMRQAHTRPHRSDEEIRTEILNAIAQNGGYETISIEGTLVNVPAQACEMAREDYREKGGHAQSWEELALANTSPTFWALGIKLDNFSERIQKVCRAVHTC